MSILRLLAGPHISEFAPASDGRHFNGTCTQASAAMAFAASLHPDWMQQQAIDFMVAMRDAMFARGEAAANGGATVANMAKELRNRGATVITEWDYAGDTLPHDWHALIKEQAGVTPILLQVANAKGLYDTAGKAEDAGVQYHAIYIAGIADTGYVVYDPNNPTVMQTGDIYNLAALQAASPCGLIQLSAPVTPGVPDGWHDDGKTLTAPNGVPVVLGFRGFVLGNHWTPTNVPQAPESGDGDHSVQTFLDCELGWTPQYGVFYGGIGAEVLQLRQQVKESQQQTLDKTTIQGIETDVQDILARLQTLTK